MSLTRLRPSREAAARIYIATIIAVGFGVLATVAIGCGPAIVAGL